MSKVYSQVTDPTQTPETAPTRTVTASVGKL
jgi:hypothetical protein